MSEGSQCAAAVAQKQKGRRGMIQIVFGNSLTVRSSSQSPSRASPPPPPIEAVQPRPLEAAAAAEDPSINLQRRVIESWTRCATPLHTELRKI